MTREDELAIEEGRRIIRAWEEFLERAEEQRRHAKNGWSHAVDPYGMEAWRRRERVKDAFFVLRGFLES